MKMSEIRILKGETKMIKYLLFLFIHFIVGLPISLMYLVFALPAKLFKVILINLEKIEDKLI